ncbi:MAG: nucleotidyltransferase family protein [Planctomycetota bacterium]
MPWTPGHRLLLAWTADVIAGRAGSAPCGWPTDRLIAIASAERVLPILSTGAAFADPAMRASVGTGIRNAVLLDLTRRACSALAGASVPVMLLKGIDLCERVYGNPALRPMHDVDLLVPRASIPPALAAISTVGLRAEEAPGEGVLRHSVVLSGPPPLRPHIHLHWHVANASYPLPYAETIDLEGLWGRSIPWTGAPGAARVPSPEDLAVYLCEHLVKHCCEEWIFAVDLLLTLRRLRPDPPAFARIARSWGVEHLCEAALRVVEGLFPRLGAGAFRDLVGPVPLTHLEHVFVRQVLSGRRSAGVNWLVYLAHCPTTRARARQLWKGVFPDAADLASLDPEEAARGRWTAYAQRGWKAVERILGR